jgi:serine/threonine protein kinase/Flp pilus assembly protein TadD
MNGQSLQQGHTLGHYVVVEKIGEGGMGVVYRATDSRLRRDVALKILPDVFANDPARLARFQHEAQVLASLNHPNIAAIYGLEEADRGHALVMEFIEGRTLAERLRDGPLPTTEMLPIARQLSEALAAAHERGIIHRDLKPPNVKITPEGHVKILDFGLAKEVHAAGDSVSWDESTGDTPIELSGVAGTLPYMAPEQLRGDALDARTDIFSLGVVLYEMVVGRRPFAGSRGARLIGEIQHSQPEPPRTLNVDVPSWLEQVILKCQEKDPGKRYRTMRQVSEVLRSGAKRIEKKLAKSLAVLYFDSPSGSEEDVYFRDGITEDIMIELSKIRDLTVLSRSAVQAFRDKPIGGTQVGAKLGAAYVLDGSMRRVGTRLRITAQLVETSTDRTVWADRFDRQLEDVFAIQGEIAQSIASALRVMLSEEERRAIAKVPTSHVKAYEYYLRGRQYFRQFRRKSIEFARQTIARAIDIDPDYAGAWAALADCHSYLYMFWEASNEHLEAADTASQRAVGLDPELAEAYVARGVAVSLREQYDAAAHEFETAIRLNPNLFEAYYFQGRGCYARGQLDQAVYWFERAIEVRPEDYQAPSLLGSALAGLERKEESRAAFRNALMRGQKLLEVEPGNTRAMYFNALALCQLGERNELAAEWADRALKMDPEEPQVLYNVGCVYALLGHADRAIDCLAATIAHGGWWKTWMRNDPDLASLHEIPRFQALANEP